MEPELFYYSFLIGRPGSLKSTWILHDIKMSAYNPRQAITMFFWLDYFRSKMTNKWMNRQKEFFTPDKSWLNLYIRQVVEYRVSGKDYYYLVKYKKVRVVNFHELADLFE